jgi:hypothetical protein
MDGLSLKEWQQAVPVLKHSKQRSVTIYSPLATVSPWVRMTKDGHLCRGMRPHHMTMRYHQVAPDVSAFVWRC